MWLPRLRPLSYLEAGDAGGSGLAGGLVQSAQLVNDLAALLRDVRFEVVSQSGYPEATGATDAARREDRRPL